MSEVVEAYEEELTDLFRQIGEKQTQAASLAGKGDKEMECYVNIEVLLDQVQDLLKQMSVEVRSLEGEERTEKNAVMAKYKAQMDEMKYAKPKTNPDRIHSRTPDRNPLHTLHSLLTV